MDFKKLPFSDQFPQSASPRRKIVSGFSLGVVISLIFLSVLLFNISFKAPFFNPMFQGFNGFGYNSSSISISWPFSFSSNTANFSSRNVYDSSSANITATKLLDPADLVQNGKTHVANATEIGSSGNFTSVSWKGVDLVDAHLRNSSEEVKDGSFAVGGNVIGEKGIEGKLDERNGNGSSIGEAVGFGDDSGSAIGKTEIIGSDRMGNLTNNGENVVTTGKEERGSVMNNPVISPEISNLTNNGENVGTLGKVERGHEMNSEVISEEEVDDTISRNDSQIVEVHKTSLKECEIFDGRWVRDDTKPYYPAGSCPHIDRDFDCHLNKRPDDGFVKWRWQPNRCDIPSLNATDFLERLRGKKLVFVGDSLNRNMWESLVCILRHSVKNKKRVYEISGKREFKKKGFYAFLFEDYNCTVDFVSSPFLVRESSFHGQNGTLETLRLDLMDRTTSMYHDADVLVFNTGHWWTHEKTSKGEDYYQEGNIVHPRLKVLEAYKRALGTWARWIDKNIDGKKTHVIFRGYSVTHFRGGYWNSGGQCHKETEPIYNDTHLAKYPSKMRALEYVLRDMKTHVTYLNISKLTDYRKDAHPSIYRMEYKTEEEQIAAVHSQDCSHWCLPGVPDTWNELLYVSLLKIGTGSWRT